MFSLLAYALLLLPTPQQEAVAIKHQLDQARELLDKQDGAGAEAAVLAIFQEHEGSEVVLRHLNALEDVLYDSLFLQEQARQAAERGDEQPPIPFAAKVLDYNPKKKVFKLRWSGRLLEDLPLRQDRLPIPIALSGKFTLKLELHPYPASGQIRLQLENDAGRRYEVDFGNASEGLHHVVAMASRVEGEQREVLNRVDKNLPVPGEEAVLMLKTVGSSLQIYQGRKRILSFKGDRMPFGAATFEGIEADALFAVEYEGKLDEDMMGARMAKATEKARLAFRREHDLGELLPAWVRPHLEGATAADDIDAATLPGGELSPPAAEAWRITRNTIAEYRDQGQPIAVLSWLQDVPPDGLPEVLRQYAMMQVAFEAGYWEHAAGHAANVLKLAPEHLPTRRRRLEALARSGDGAGAWQMALELYQERPEVPAPILQATLLLMRLGMVDELRILLQEAKDLPPDLMARCTQLLEQREGPQGRSFRRQAERQVEFRTDLPEEEAASLSSFCQRVLGRAQGFLPSAKVESSHKLRVFLFADRWDYEEFADALLPSAHPSAAGFFAPEFDAVLAWHHPDRAALEASLRRELMLHLGYRIHPDYPIWASVGLAEIVADDAMDPDGTIEVLSRQAADLYLTAKDEGFLPFTTMLYLGGPAYYGLEGERSMTAQSWATTLVIVLIAGMYDIDLLDLMVQDLSEGRSWADTMDEVLITFTTNDLGEVNSVFRFFIRRLGQLLPT